MCPDTTVVLTIFLCQVVEITKFLYRYATYFHSSFFKATHRVRYGTGYWLNTCSLFRHRRLGKITQSFTEFFPASKKVWYHSRWNQRECRVLRGVISTAWVVSTRIVSAVGVLGLTLTLTCVVYFTKIECWVLGVKLNWRTRGKRDKQPYRSQWLGCLHRATRRWARWTTRICCCSWKQKNK